MFSKFTNEIKCEVCSGDLHFDYNSTADDYQILMSSTTVDIYDKEKIRELKRTIARVLTILNEKQKEN